MSNEVLNLELKPKSVLESVISDSDEEKEAMGRKVTALTPLTTDGDNVVLKVSTSRNGKPRREDLYELDLQSQAARRIIGAPIKQKDHANWRFLGDTTLLSVVTDNPGGFLYRTRYAMGLLDNHHVKEQIDFHFAGYLLQGNKGPMSVSLRDGSVHGIRGVKLDELQSGLRPKLLFVKDGSFNHRLVNLVSQKKNRSLRLDSLVKINDDVFAAIVHYQHYGEFCSYAAPAFSEMVIIDGERKRKRQRIFTNSIANASSLDGFLSVVLQDRECQSANYGDIIPINRAVARTYHYDDGKLKTIGEQTAFNPNKDDDLLDFHLVRNNGEVRLLFAYRNSIRLTNINGEVLSEFEVGNRKEDNPEYPRNMKINYHLLSGTHLFRTAESGLNSTFKRKLAYTEMFDVSGDCQLIDRTTYGGIKTDLSVLDGSVFLYFPQQDKLQVQIIRAA